MFSNVDHSDIELACFSDEVVERMVRQLVRARYGEEIPITPDELPVAAHGFKSIGLPPSEDLLRLQRAIHIAEDGAASRAITQHVRTIRLSEVDALKALRRVLLNAEAGAKYSRFELELRATGPVVALVARITGGKSS